MLPSEENVYYSIPVDPLEKSSLEKAYALFGQTTLPGISLTIAIRKPLPDDSLRFITSFLFIPAYLRIGDSPVINLSGEVMDVRHVRQVRDFQDVQEHNPELLQETAARLSAYLSAQGIQSFIINIVLPAGQGGNQTDNGLLLDADNRMFPDKEALLQYYKKLLQSDRYYKRNVFFYASSREECQAAFGSLQQIEKDFKEHAPALYSLIRENSGLELELQSLRRQYAGTVVELKNQQQYVEVLRSAHATKEIQDYYTNEYEILPLWYKRFGHILKVLTGKRAFKSLYRDDVKKYKG